MAAPPSRKGSFKLPSFKSFAAQDSFTIGKSAVIGDDDDNDDGDDEEKDHMPAVPARKGSLRRKFSWGRSPSKSREGSATHHTSRRGSSMLRSLRFSFVRGATGVRAMDPRKDGTYHGILLRDVNFDLHDSVEPLEMFKQARLAFACFGDFDAEGIPYSVKDGEPLSPEAVAWCRKESAAMARRFEADEALRSDRERVLRGESELSAKLAKALLADLRRQEDRDGRVVVDPRKMFTAAGKVEKSGKGKGSSSAKAILFDGLFSEHDAIGRPTAGVKIADATVPMVLPKATVKALHAAHRAQAQRFLDHYKPRLDQARAVDVTQHFRAGKYAGKFSQWTAEGLPVAHADGSAVKDRKQKRKFADELQRVTKRWEAEEARLTKSLHEVALIYNQTTAKAKEGEVGKEALKHVLTAYGLKDQRVATAKALRATAQHGGGDAHPAGGAAPEAQSPTTLVPTTNKKKKKRQIERRAVIIRAKKAGIKLVNDAETEALTVGKVLAGSEAEQKGVRGGDRFLSVNDVDYEFLDRKEAARRLAAVLAEHGTATIMLERNLAGSGGAGGDGFGGFGGGAAAGTASASSGAERKNTTTRRGGIVVGPVGEIKSRAEIWRISMYQCWMTLIALPFVFWNAVPPRDSCHAFLESDRWSVAVVLLVLADTVMSPHREDSAAINAVGIAISLFFLVELTSRLYLWRYVRGTLSTFFVAPHTASDLPFWKRINVLNFIDCIVVFVDILILLIQLAAQSGGGSMASVMRLSRLGRVFRYFRLAKNLRSLRFLHVFKNNAHIIYSKLVSNKFILFIGVLVVVDIVLLVIFGGGANAPLPVILFAVFVSIFFLLELFLRLACHYCVLGELWSFIRDPYNDLDIIVAVIDGIALVVFFAGVSTSAGGIKVVRMLRVLRSLTKVLRWTRVVHVLRTARICRLCHILGLVDCFCPVRITAQQKEDLALYGVMLEDGYEDEDFNDLGAMVKQRKNIEEFDQDEIDAAWAPLTYEAGASVANLRSSKATLSRHGGLGAVSQAGILRAERDVNASRGDTFLFNAITGEVKWDDSHLRELAAKRSSHASKRFRDFERRTYIRESRDMAREDVSGTLLRHHSRQVRGLLACFRFVVRVRCKKGQRRGEEMISNQL